MRDRKGKVYIVGAGPGDPGLMTVKGLQKLQLADAVVYDRLVNNDLLSYCKKDCEKIFVGKESGYHSVEQDRIIEILLSKSEQGLAVVRLKGGNPFIFGRGSEEAMALSRAGIEFEIIPGITSGLSAPIYSGIPITHRGLITQCVLVTAHESPGKPGTQTQVEWDKLALLKNTTLIIYMGASRIESICDELMKHGMDPSLPSAVIENGTLPKQRTVTGRLDDIACKFKDRGFHAPAIIMISPTVTMRDDISWYENKPLFGKRIVIAGNSEQIDRMREMVWDLGGEPLPLTLAYPDFLHELLRGNGKNDEDDLFRDPELSSDDNRTRYEVLDERTVSAILTRKSSAAMSERSDLEVVKDIVEKRADAFVFTSSAAVENFFSTMGYEAAREAIDHGVVAATTRGAAGALVERRVQADIISSNCATEGIQEMFLNLFSKLQE